MTKINDKWQDFIAIVRQDVVPAIGCTEPISLALAAAIAAQKLEQPVHHIEAKVSGNLMKNGMGVTVPGTGMKGLPIAAAVGALGGDPEGRLEVLKNLTDQQVAEAKKMLAEKRVTLEIAAVPNILYSEAKVFAADGSWALAAIADSHTNVIKISRNGEILFAAEKTSASQSTALEAADIFAAVKLQEIYDFATTISLDEIAFIKEAAVLNHTLSQAGLANEYGLHIGVTMQRQIKRGLLSNDLLAQIVARTTAASDARMGGASLPAMTNSGSGNQGIAATMPVVVMAEHLKATDEEFIRALMLSHLTAIYIHSKLPKLSAFCAVTTASMGSAAGMAWLLTKKYDVVAAAVTNMVSDITGMICDGASNSCAMKVSTSVTSAYKALLMAADNTKVEATDGIVDNDIDKTIANLGKLATNGMQETDKEILNIMVAKNA